MLSSLNRESSSSNRESSSPNRESSSSNRESSSPPQYTIEVLSSKRKQKLTKIDVKQIKQKKKI